MISHSKFSFLFKIQFYPHFNFLGENIECLYNLKIGKYFLKQDINKL